MKQLFLIRHAKSSAGYRGMADHDRPLNRRGFHAASDMGKRMSSWQWQPQQLVSSSAVRAWSTTELIANELKYDVNNIEIEPAIYEATSAELLHVIQGLEDGFQRVALVGHNPGFTMIANLLGRCDIDNVPTCGIVVLQFEVNTWASISPGEGVLQHYDYPKNRTT